MPALRYERVNDHDQDEPESPDTPTGHGQHPIPNSPPPSFHSRTSSIQSREHRVNADLADAFDADDSDDDADDTQRLVRSTSTPGSNTPPSTTADSTRAAPSLIPVPQPPRSTTQTTGRIYGGGIQSDGVFSNITARPETGEVKEEQPPTYEQAAADAAPPYWETTILAPGLDGGEVFIDGMPVGPLFSFMWNGFISFTIQPFVGFLLTYLLHSSHAAKNGSRAGLGMQLIQNGFSLKSATFPGSGRGMGPGGDEDAGYSQPPDPNSHDFDPDTVTAGGDNSAGSIAGMDWAAYILMIVGWFILIRAVADYVRARRHEQLVLQSPDRGLGIPIIAEGESPDRVV